MKVNHLLSGILGASVLPLLVATASADAFGTGGSFGDGQDFANEHGVTDIGDDTADVLPDSEGDVSEQRSLFQGGQGDAAGPGLGRAAGCVGSDDDPECAAINMMNQGEAHGSGDYELTDEDQQMREEARQIQEDAESIVGPDMDTEAACVETKVKTPDKTVEETCTIARDADITECAVPRVVEVDSHVQYECEDGYSEDLYTCSREYKYEYERLPGLSHSWLFESSDTITGFGFDEDGNVHAYRSRLLWNNGWELDMAQNLRLDADTGSIIEVVADLDDPQGKLGAPLDMLIPNMWKVLSPRTVTQMRGGSVIMSRYQGMRLVDGDLNEVWDVDLRWPGFPEYANYYKEGNSAVVVAGRYDGSETRVFVESFDADTGQREWVRSIERRTGTQQERGYGVRSAYIDEDRGRLHFMYFINNGRSYRDVIIDLEDGSVIRDRRVSNTVWNNTPVNVVYPGGEYYFQLWNERVEQRRVSDDSRVASYRPPGYSWMGTMLVDFYGNVYVSGQLSNGNYFVASASGNSDVNEIGWIDGCEGLGSM